MKTKNDELISVLVLSYRSAETVIDTLQSIYKQTYQQIELVVTDDSSDDNSIEIINSWMENNKNRFQRTILVTSEENTGTSKSTNRGVQACNGQWIKIIAADDLLLPDCVEKYVEQLQKDEKKIKIYQADEQIINDKGEVTGYLPNERLRMKKVSEMETVEEQYRYFLYNDVKVSPTMFFSRSTFYEVGACDERIRNIEDYPLKLRFLKNGYRMGYLGEETVQYRVHDSISHRKDVIYPVEHIKQKRLVRKLCCYPEIPKSKIVYWISEILEKFQENMIIYVFGNKPGVLAGGFMKAMGYLNMRKWERRMLDHENDKHDRKGQ